jgi:hypothetical protein
MKQTYLLLLIFSFNAWSRVNLELSLDNPSVKQGEIVIGRLSVLEAEGQAVLTGLKGKKIEKTLYLLSVSPFMGKQGQLEAEAKVIFLSIPQKSEVAEILDGEEVSIKWNNIEVIATPEPKSFLLGDFEIPTRANVVYWIIVFLSIAVIALLTSFFLKHFSKKKKAKNKILSLKKELLDCITYEDVVEIWEQKRKYIETFPKLDKSFKILENVLFKYQFKSQRTKTETDEVVQAYNVFKSNVSGALNET